MCFDKRYFALNFLHLQAKITWIMCFPSPFQIAAPSLLEKTGFQHHMRVKSYDDFGQYSSSDKLVNKSRGPTENSLTKSIASDKEKANNVAKIKVVVSRIRMSSLFYCSHYYIISILYLR